MNPQAHPRPIGDEDLHCLRTNLTVALLAASHLRRRHPADPHLARVHDRLRAALADLTAHISEIDGRDDTPVR